MPGAADEAVRDLVRARRRAHTTGGFAAEWTNPRPSTAAAHKLARLIYTMLTKGQEYTDQGQDYYEERYRKRVSRALSQRAAKLDIPMVPNASAEQPAEKPVACQSLGGSF